MKKTVIMIVAVFALAVLGILICSAPRTFGNGIDASEVDHINVFDGNTGVGFTIDRPEDIRHIVESIQSRLMKRNGLSFGHMGYSFRISYINEKDKNIIPEFIVNSDDTIRRDPFFYRCEGGLCYDYLKTMEEAYASRR
ncbi:MAG: hypothetical protein IKO00_01760 [Oscillospiraceae bacterium]|nr:hypothetical protein [Oscillospiraceae bacterium]